MRLSFQLFIFLKSYLRAFYKITIHILKVLFEGILQNHGQTL